MKKIISIFYVYIILILCIPIMSAKAISCNNKILNISDQNFICNGIDGENLTFLYNGQDYSDYFNLKDNLVTIDPSIIFPSDVEVVELEVKDASSSTKIKIKNNNYVTTTTTTTTQPLNIIIVSFDKNDGSEISEKKCSMIEGSSYCSVVLPKLNLEGFNGWGTQKECKEGISGTVKVYEDIKYYACYKDNVSERASLKLKSLDILDKKTLDKIDFGDIIDGKDTYNIRVLYEVDSLIVNAVSEDKNVVVNVENNNDLVIGNNKIYIKLNDKTNNQKIFTLNVERLEEGEPLIKKHYLSSLVIGGSEINFNKEILEYNITVEESIEQLIITKIPFYENDVVTVKGNENLVNGSKIFIEVTGEDGGITTYTINVFKEAKDSNILLIVLILLIILLIVIIMIIFIKRNKTSNKEVRKTKSKIKKAKNKVKDHKPEVLKDNKNNDEIEVLKF